MQVKQTKPNNNRALFETVARMDERMQQMSADIKELKENIPNWSKANYALYGADGHSGIVKEVEDIKTIVSELKEWKVAVTTKIATISAIVGGGFSLLVKYLFGG